jgi:hypothetical protein
VPVFFLLFFLLRNTGSHPSCVNYLSFWIWARPSNVLGFVLGGSFLYGQVIT